MPANFPTTEQKRYYGRFVEAPTPEQLGSYFHLADTDRSLIYSRTKEHTQLGLAVQLGTVRFLGLFLPDSQWVTVPKQVVQYVATQLSLEPALWSQYFDGRRPTLSEHQTLIRQQYGYRDFTHPAVQFSTVRWLYTRAWLHDEPPSRLFDTSASLSAGSVGAAFERKQSVVTRHYNAGGTDKPHPQPGIAPHLGASRPAVD
ncbi:MAG: DUF4158 domain-containing protein [Chloroflexi bacterium]|nr:DUF4158 domain-containing protein [Chloroflexota bacterium]MCI0729621.1 DUF4158 domain-containing protein [Chloroflexota bacterium]